MELDYRPAEMQLFIANRTVLMLRLHGLVLDSDSCLEVRLPAGIGSCLKFFFTVRTHKISRRKLGLRRFADITDLITPKLAHEDTCRR